MASGSDRPPLTEGEVHVLDPQIPQWQVREADGVKRIERVFKFKNFAEALEFTNKVGAIAEEGDHYPLIITEYGWGPVDWVRIRSGDFTRKISLWLQCRMNCRRCISSSSELSICDLQSASQSNKVF